MTVLESYGSREYELGRKDASYKLLGSIVGSDDEQVVFVEWQAFCPNIAYGLLLLKLSIKQDGPLVWRGEAEYGLPEDQEPEKPKFGEVSFNFETGGGKQLITTSDVRGVTPYCAVGNVHDQLGGAINFDGETVHGVEIIVPSLTFEVETRIPGGRLTMSFARTMAGITGCVNKERFLDCEGGTLLFEGCSGSYKVGENVDRNLKFKFAYSPNKVNIKVGDILVEKKRGWQYMWTWFRKQKDNADLFAVVMKPFAVYVHTLYEEVDFKTYLGFG